MTDIKEKLGKLPETIWFRSTRWPAGTLFPGQSLPCGKLMYCCEGLAEVNVDNIIYLSTPEYAIWIPSYTSHHSMALNNLKYVIIHFHKNLCDSLPADVTTIKINGIVKAIIEDFSRRDIGYPISRIDINLAKVLTDQVGISETFDSFLPLSEDKIIKKMTTLMLNDPEEILTLKEWCEIIGLSERTLSRRFLSATGVNFNEWKLRRKILYAFKLLQAGNSVKFVSASLGYNDPSAFISMFKKRTGITPAQVE